MDWTDTSSMDAPRIPEGEEVIAEITRVSFANKDGQAFTSRAGDPRICLTFTDDTGREVAFFATLNDKAGWTLRSILQASGTDMAKLNEYGVVPAHFANEEWAKPRLIGKRLKIRVKEYFKAESSLGEIVALRPQAASTPPPQASPTTPPPANDAPPALPDDDIPI